MIFTWSDLAFGSKKPLKELEATFVVAPREISTKRFTEIVKEYLPKGHILFGIADEDYIDGFDQQPQFKTLKYDQIEQIVEKIGRSGTPYQVHILRYSQRDLPYILEKVSFQQVLLVNGSWHRSFHTRPEYYILAQKRTQFSYIAAFVDEAEARQYERSTELLALTEQIGAKLSDEQLLDVASQAARLSYDTSFQTGAALAHKGKLLAWGYNKVVPFQTYAMLHGASRERHFSPPQDLNHYDAIHAETMLVVGAGQIGLALYGTSLYINLLPCPTCARMLSQTSISEVVYTEDHSDGYAIKLLEESGKKVRRIVP